MCKLCSESPEYAGGKMRKCGFSAISSEYPAPVFSAGNSHCATLDRLKSYAVQYGKAITAYGCGRIWVLPVQARGGWIVITSITGSGIVDSAIYMEDDRGYLLPLAIAEEVCEYYGGLACARDCEVL